MDRPSKHRGARRLVSRVSGGLEPFPTYRAAPLDEETPVRALAPRKTPPERRTDQCVGGVCFRRVCATPGARGAIDRHGWHLVAAASRTSRTFLREHRSRRRRRASPEAALLWLGAPRAYPPGRIRQPSPRRGGRAAARQASIGDLVESADTGIFITEGYGDWIFIEVTFRGLRPPVDRSVERQAHARCRSSGA